MGLIYNYSCHMLFPACPNGHEYFVGEVSFVIVFVLLL